MKRCLLFLVAVNGLVMEGDLFLMVALDALKRQRGAHRNLDTRPTST